VHAAHESGAGNARPGDHHVPCLGEPLGPESLTWRTLGDWRLALVGMRAGLLQAMHPAIDKGLRDHSDYFAGPFDRIVRSVPQIAGVVYDADRRATAARVRDYHRPIRGELEDGSRYHALDPDTYYWAHATFFEAQVAAMHFFGRELTDDQKERLYQESVQWYSLYDLSMRPVPRDYADFCRYWDHMVADVLEVNRFAVGTFRRRAGALGPSPSRLLPTPVWNALSDRLYVVGVWLVRATLPPALRERIGLSWTARDERRLRVLAGLLRHGFGRLPLSLRLAPPARAAFRREGARL
jgi:uncharacterized protein (DUF2236 family)